MALAGADVQLIARGRHLEALRDRGLKVKSIAGDFEVQLPVTDDPAETGSCDVVLFCVKSYDTERAASQLRPLLGTDTAVLSLQNGVGNEDLIASVVGPGHVMGGAAFIFSTIAGLGEIEHTGGPGRVVFGELDGSRSQRAERLLELCVQANIPAELTDNIRHVLWHKLGFICAQAGMTAAARLPVDEILTIAESREMFLRISDEVCAVAAAEGVPLPDETPDRHLEFAQSLEPGSFSSLHHDLTHRGRMELEALHGEVVRLAARHGVPAPMCQAIYALLRPHALRYEPESASLP